MTESDVFIAAAARTPIGSFLGGLSGLSAPRIGAAAISGALERARVTKAQVELVCMGNVLSAGVGQAPARQAALHAGLPESVPAVTISKVCGSGLEAVIAATRAIRLGDVQIAVAGGMESMSQAPYLLPRARTGYRLGHAEVLDSVLKDGLLDAYGGLHMGQAAERCAAELSLDRERQDAFARSSYEKARASQSDGKFAQEIVAVEVPDERSKGAARTGSGRVPHRAHPRHRKSARARAADGGGRRPIRDQRGLRGGGAGLHRPRRARPRARERARRRHRPGPPHRRFRRAHLDHAAVCAAGA